MQPPVAKIDRQTGDFANPIVSCPHCGAANPAGVPSCHQCHGALRETGIDEYHHAIASADAYKPLSRPPTRLTTGVLVAGAVVLATLAVIGNYAYEILTLVDIPLGRGTLPTAVGDGAEGRPGADDWGIIGRGASVGDAPVAKSTAMAGDEVPAPEAKTEGAAALAPSRATVADKTVGRAQSGKAPCTEGVTAQGLCKENSMQKKK
jgi:hypothetical protein